MKILIYAYACEPGAGSEYAVGWMVPFTMAQNYPQNEIYVITRGICHDKIENALAELSFPNLHFLFYDIPKWMIYRNEMQSHWGEQINYLLWQLMVRKYVRKQNRRLQFDIAHHLTFNQYRTPSPGFWMDIPFVFGPIGGAETIAQAFWEDLETHTQKKERIRAQGKDLKILKWFTKRRNNKKIILCSSQENVSRISSVSCPCEVRLLPAIGFAPSDFSDAEGKESMYDSHPCFEMIYAGKALDWKGINIFLKAVSISFMKKKTENWKVKLIGIRYEEEKQKVMRWIDELQLNNHIILIPFIQRAELLKLMSNSSISVYPAFRDSGSMSVLEACAIGCPTICFNTGGQDIFPDNILLKVEVKQDYQKTLEAFADKLEWAYQNPQKIKEIGRRSQTWVRDHLTWDKKVDDFVEIYKELINK